MYFASFCYKQETLIWQAVQFTISVKNYFKGCLPCSIMENILPSKSKHLFDLFPDVWQGDCSQLPKTAEPLENFENKNKNELNIIFHPLKRL